MAASVLLAAGCHSVPPNQTAARKHTISAPAEQPSDQHLAEAHAHYAAGIVSEMSGELGAALDSYYKAAQLDPADDTLVLEVSRRLLENKQPEKALEVVQRAAAQPGASADIYARLGMAYTQLGKFEEAVAANRIAIRKAPGSLTAYQGLYLTYMRSKHPQEALKVLEEASRQLKGDAESLVELAELYASYALQAPTQRTNLNAKALVLLSRAERVGAMTPILRLKLADGFNLLGESAKAAQLYLKVLKDPPDLPLVNERVRANLAEIYLRSSDHKRAAEQLEAIMAEDPTNPQVYYYLGRMALEDKKPAEAADALRKTILLKPDQDAAYYALAVAQLDLNKPADALATLAKAREKFGQNFELEFYTGLAHMRQKDYAQAVQHFTAAEVIANATAPQRLSESFYFQIGAACERKGDLAQAERYFQMCLKLAPNFAEALNYLGYMWVEHDQNLAQAREMIEKAVKAEPKNAAFLDSLAWVLFKLKQPKEALPHALKAVELTEEPDATVYDHLGDIYAALGQVEKSREAWRKSVSIEPNAEVQKKLDAGARK